MIIGLTGRPPAGSGKDTAADYLVKESGFCKVALSDPMKRFCKEMFDFSDEQLWGSSEMRNEADRRFCRTRVTNPDDICDVIENVQPIKDRTGDFLNYLTPRYALQQLGTQWGRDCYQDVWADYCLRVCHELLETDGFMYRREEGIISQWENTCQGEWKNDDAPSEGRYNGVVIPDVRYDNEAKAIRKAGGKIWLILRPGAGLEGEAGKHSSEDGISEDLVDNCIKNDGSFEWLYEQVQVLMKQ